MKSKEEQGLQGQQFENGFLVTYVPDLPAVLESPFFSCTYPRKPASERLPGSLAFRRLPITKELLLIFRIDHQMLGFVYVLKKWQNNANRIQTARSNRLMLPIN
ncbi:hypothetical protein BIU88_08400 [Chlorobaculum limnaeum]|uniref:Uncharacterized protein n=1 Tax=Chlorobaculum limnaeum TaxID=274537 RepID=A0A1D8CZ30_CHLLM|nr:hypothetical protein [Chlorobaculum limnaeum]AOS84146.1 hypothetical protein BIU88_08400 [Chlorobaculum limnaeum]